MNPEVCAALGIVKSRLAALRRQQEEAAVQEVRLQALLDDAARKRRREAHLKRLLDEASDLQRRAAARLITDGDDDTAAADGASEAAASAFAPTILRLEQLAAAARAESEMVGAEGAKVAAMIMAARERFELEPGRGGAVWGWGGDLVSSWGLAKTTTHARTRCQRLEDRGESAFHWSCLH